MNIRWCSPNKYGASQRSKLFKIIIIFFVGECRWKTAQISAVFVNFTHTYISVYEVFVFLAVFVLRVSCGWFQFSQTAWLHNNGHIELLYGPTIKKQIYMANNRTSAFLCPIIEPKPLNSGWKMNISSHCTVRMKLIYK